MRVLETEEVLDDGIPENEMVEPGAHALLTAGFTNDVSVGVVNPSKPATRKPSHKPRPSGSSSAAEPSQKPAGKRDERSKKQLLESIQDGPDTDERMAFVRAANANSTQSALTFDELKPQHDAAEYMQQGTNGMERSEEEKERDQRYLEVNVVLPKSKMLLSQITCEGCKNSALECCCCDDHDNTHCYALMSKAKLTPDEQMVYMKWGATSRYDPAIEVSDGDRIDRGLQPRDAEAVTAGQLRRPCIQSSQAWDPKSKCPWRAAKEMGSRCSCCRRSARFTSCRRAMPTRPMLSWSSSSRTCASSMARRPTRRCSCGWGRASAARMASASCVPA